MKKLVNKVVDMVDAYGVLGVILMALCGLLIIAVLIMIVLVIITGENVEMSNATKTTLNLITLQNVLGMIH